MANVYMFGQLNFKDRRRTFMSGDKFRGIFAAGDISLSLSSRARVRGRQAGLLSHARLISLATVTLLLGQMGVAQEAPIPSPHPRTAEEAAKDILLSSPTLNPSEPLQGPGGELLAAPGAEGLQRATWSVPAVQARTIGRVSALEVRPDIQMLTIDGFNMAVQSGPDGVLVVGGAGRTPGSCEALVAAVKQVASGPIRYIINTSADADQVRCNAVLAKVGHAFVPGVRGFDALVMAHHNALLRLISQPGPQLEATAYPSATFSGKARNFNMNGQAVQVIWMPNAHTDGDSVVLFRRSDVVVTGDLFDPTRFPVIDLQHGGSIQKHLDALNELVNFLVVPSVPKVHRAGGTLVIPARGALSSHLDLVNYRGMLTVIKERVQSLIDEGRTFAQIKAADVTRGYTARYGSASGDWTTDDFIKAVYESLIAEKRASEVEP